MSPLYQARWQQSRGISTRLIITGNLILTSPAHLGNGDRGSNVDLPLLLDTVEGRPLLQGSSLAGALRNYLRAYEQGLRQAEKRGYLAELLFGGVKGDPQGDQSPLIIDDALGEPTTPEKFDAKVARVASVWRFADLEIRLTAMRASGGFVGVSEVWLVPGVEHNNLPEVAGGELQRRLGEFFAGLGLGEGL
jgi:hypothetical protein